MREVIPVYRNSEIVFARRLRAVRLKVQVSAVRKPSKTQVDSAEATRVYNKRNSKLFLLDTANMPTDICSTCY